MSLHIIAARSLNNVIGKDGKLPWHWSEDLKHFKEVTKGHAIIMGRKTWESLPGALPDRLNIVLSERLVQRHDSPYKVARNWRQALDLARGREVFVIGGAKLYESALHVAEHLWLSELTEVHEGDTYFPDWSPENWEQVSVSHGERGDFVHYRRKK